MSTITRYIHNLSGVEVRYIGVPIAVGSSYLIPSDKYVNFSNDDDLLVDVASGVSGISADNATSLTGSDGINLLKDVQYSVDSEGAQVTRLKMSQAGWTYQARALEFNTGGLNSLVNNKADGTIWGDATLKFYNSSDVEVTTQLLIDLTAVKTVLEWEPTYDYEIVGGFLSMPTTPLADYRVYVVAVPDVSEELGGSKLMVSGINMKSIPAGSRLLIDGRTAKRMNYSDSLHTNKIQLSIEHAPGSSHNFMIVFEHFKA